MAFRALGTSLRRPPATDSQKSSIAQHSDRSRQSACESEVSSVSHVSL